MCHILLDFEFIFFSIQTLVPALSEQKQLESCIMSAKDESNITAKTVPQKFGFQLGVLTLRNVITVLTSYS